MKNKWNHILFHMIPAAVLIHTALFAQEGDTTAVDQSLTQTLQATRPHIEWQLSFARIFWTIIFVLIAFIVIRYLSRFLENLAERSGRLRLVIKRFVPIFRVFGWTVTIYIIISAILAPPIETIIAVTASAGIAIGFASQDILKNIFGGIMILFDRPFQVGDKIQVGSHYGEVIQIGLRTVRIKTPDDSLVSVPNGEIINQSVSNSNAGESHCQVVTEIYLPPDIDLTQTRRIAYRAAAVSRYVYLRKPLTVLFKNEILYGRSVLKMKIKAYVLDLRYEFAFSSEVTETVMRQLVRQNVITGAFPEAHAEEDIRGGNESE